jgi:hypothetical protein
MKFDKPRKNNFMKKIHLFILSAALMLMVATSCKKDETPAPVPPAAKTLSELKADPGFAWTTGQSVELKIKGLPTVIEVRNTLKVVLANGNVLFTRLHLMSEDLTVKLVIPSTEKQITLVYGTMSYPVDVLNGNANFSFIPNVED